jgi:hypothetical protein
VLPARFGHVWATLAFLSRDAAVEADVFAEHLHQTLWHVVSMESVYKGHRKGQIAVSTSSNGVDSCKLCSFGDCVENVAECTQFLFHLHIAYTTPFAEVGTAIDRIDAGLKHRSSGYTQKL